MEWLYSINFPSKLPEYLAGGLQFVLVGPESATGVRWARRHTAAVHLLEADAPDAWSAELSRLASSAELRSSLATGAWEAGINDFDPVAIRVRFRSALCEAVGR